jgi:hypothetical protein
MEFRLIYEGPLSSGQNDGRVKEKHEIRKQFHAQLKALWEDHPSLQFGLMTGTVTPHLNDPSSARETTMLNELADAYKMFGYRFVPLIRKSSNLRCSLDILFLRKDLPGGIIRSHGDLDNRIKVLFDSLRIPENAAEIPKGQSPSQEEDPFFCLLQDDKLIVDFSVTSDRLLRSPQSSTASDLSHVVLVLHVKVLASEHDLSWWMNFKP